MAVIMIQGTASDVGKSVLVAGLCRIFSQDGYATAPFKSQNMALNSGITPDGKEMGRAQIFQAEAAGIAPDVRMNPILLKPRSDSQSQVVLMGEVVTDMNARRYHQYKPQLREKIRQVFQSLSADHDIIVLEGAGSPAEINLRDRDIVNMGMAEIANSPVILVADIDRGGVFAALYGTIALLLEHEKPRVQGIIINKFRGDLALLQPGLEQIEALTGVPVLGVMPWLELEFEEEDSLALVGKYQGRQPQVLDVVVVKLPYVSNFTDFNALAAQPDVRVRYLRDGDALQTADLVILPGSKNTLHDLQWLRDTRLSDALQDYHQAGGKIIGICGGYQMLGQFLYDGVESEQGAMAGLGLLNVSTRFERQKTTTVSCGEIQPGLPGGWDQHCGQDIRGYEVHMGQTVRGPGVQAFCQLKSRNGQPQHDSLDGAVSVDGSVLGTYLHGLFDNTVFTRQLLDSLRQQKGIAPYDGPVVDYQQFKQQQFDQLAAEMRRHIDIQRIYQIMRQYQEADQ
nr:cobyric acid synthase [Citrobacter sp. JGM124]